MRAPMLVLLVTACGTQGADDAGDVESELPYVLPDEELPTSDIDVDALAAPVEAALRAASGITATPVFDAFLAATVDHDPLCPPLWTETETALQWYGDCTTTSGTRYQGYALYEVGVDEYGVAVTTLYGSGSIATADGHTLRLGGYAAMGRGDDGASVSGVSAVVGSFAWDGPEADGTWLEDAEDMDLTVSWVRADWGRYLVVAGSVTAPDGTPVHFDEVALLDAYCRGEPSGTVSVRAPEGWVDATFDLDVNDVEGTDPGTCDGCGAAWYRGVEAGALCLDVADVADFGDAPW